jgi:HK97 family phage major capsid protein
MPPEITLDEVHGAVKTLREEVKATRVDTEKVERINVFLDEAEEKILTPLTLATQETAKREIEVKELITKLETSNASAAEIKERMNALELTLARGVGSAADRDHKESSEYKALNEFCVRGMNSLDQEQKVLLRTDSAVDGGVLVTVELDTMITKKITEVDPIRAIARVRTISGKSVELPIRNTIPTATYEGEAEEGTDSVTTYQSSTVTPFRQTYTVPITMDMLMDAAFDMEAEIASDAAEAFAFGEGAGFVSGSGHKEPAGFVSNAVLQAATRTTAASGVLDPEAIILLTGDLKVGYDPVYVLNRATLALIRTFRGDAASAGDAAGQFLWMPGMSGEVMATLNGFPYVLANSMPIVAAGNFAMAFGDFRRGYTIVDRTGMTVVRDEFSEKRKGIVEFTMNRWNTGQVTLAEPIKLLKIKA